MENCRRQFLLKTKRKSELKNLRIRNIKRIKWISAISGRRNEFAFEIELGYFQKGIFSLNFHINDPFKIRVSELIFHDVLLLPRLHCKSHFYQIAFSNKLRTIVKNITFNKQRTDFK